MPQCTARSKRSGEQCRRAAMPNGKCYMHGGAQPRGMASPNTKHGLYSKDLPTRLRSRYEQAEANAADILNLSSNVALLDTLIADAAQNLSTYESGELWMQLRESWTQLGRAMAAKDDGAYRAAYADCERLIRDGVADAFARIEISKLSDTKRKTVDTEARRRVKANEMLTVSEGVMLVTALGDIVTRHVHDTATRAAIGSDLARLLDRQAGPDAQPQAD